ncbi:DUF3761 domain-containing protein [Sinomonas susongensis]|uniref:DUF3761 domain-containing protein n=1 Tax=Sinomonas susongensis TaxID=1324851 RepID=UPI001FECB5CA|nr:DUF3761 domain-containing protein [Sinomonas susongensis]
MGTKDASKLLGVAAAALTLALAGCGGTPVSSAGGVSSFAPSSSATASPRTSPSATGTPFVTPTATPTTAAAPASSAPPYAGAALGGTYAAAVGGAGILPDGSVTPGATNPAVSQGDIGTTICVSNWTTTVRPPSSYTSQLKLDQLRAGYSYNGDLNPADYEEDHLIPLELGGAPSDVHNLWPEPSTAATGGSKAKDELENKLHSLVCSGQLALASAQQAIASNWWDAYEQYVAPAAAPAPAPAAPAQPVAPAPAPAAPAQPDPAPAAPAPAPVAPAPAGAMAKCNDGTLSYSATHSGTCSHHGGVAIWYR